jgi:hypothetical protein
VGCFHCLVIVNSATINISVQMSLLYPDLNSFRYVPRSSITWSYGSSLFSFLKNLYTAFHNGCTNLHSQHKSIRVPVSSHPYQHLLLFVFLMIASLPEVRWNLSAILIFISFMAREVEHFFMYLSAICTYSFENSLFNSCAHFLSGFLILRGLNLSYL